MSQLNQPPLLIEFLTGYAGVIAAQGDAAGLVGAAFNTPVGAVALDVTQANASTANVHNTSGQSPRLCYCETLDDTGTFGGGLPLFVMQVWSMSSRHLG